MVHLNIHYPLNDDLRVCVIFHWISSTEPNQPSASFLLFSDFAVVVAAKMLKYSIHDEIRN